MHGVSEACHSQRWGGKSNITKPPVWPHRCLAQVPSSRGMCDLVQDVRAMVQPDDPTGPLHLRTLCGLGRFRIIERDLSASEGGVEAVLIPQAGNRFRIWVDPTPPGGWDKIPPKLRLAVRRHRLRFRVAHEIAHSFFYRRDGGEPHRVVADSPEQEEFADAFARSLLVPAALTAATPSTPDGVVDLHDSCDVSLEVALRAFSQARGSLSAVLLHWPVGAALTADTARVQWATADVTREGRRTLHDRVREIVQNTESGLSPVGGSTLVLKRRRQVVWMEDGASGRASVRAHG
jgi:hypothetical protein